LQRASRLSEPRRKAPATLDVKRYQRRVWLTRPRPQIDRVGSAWLIRKFIDPRAAFASRPSRRSSRRHSYDMMDVEFTHHATIAPSRPCSNASPSPTPAARRMGEMIHDADLEDGKFQRPECVGLDLLFKGWGASRTQRRGDFGQRLWLLRCVARRAAKGWLTWVKRCAAAAERGTRGVCFSSQRL